MRVFVFQICEELGIKCPSNVKLFTGKSKDAFAYYSSVLGVRVSA